MRRVLHPIGACARLAANSETTGVFVGALWAGEPPVSIRVVSDLGDDRSLGDFRINARRVSRELYRYVFSLVDSGWFAELLARWRDQGLSASRMAKAVLPWPRMVGFSCRPGGRPEGAALVPPLAGVPRAM